MTRDLTPTEGARYLLDLTQAAGSSANYRATIFTPTTQHVIDVTVVDDGTFTLGATDAPSELADRLGNMAKLVARDANKRREDGLPPWPARVLRWRK